MGELLQQFGNVNTGVQDGIIFLSGLIVWDCVFFSFCFALVTRESRRSNKTPKKWCDIKLGNNFWGVVTAASEKSLLLN